MEDNGLTEKSRKADWFVVHTYSGYENKVKADIEKAVENRGMEEEILEVLVPSEKVTEYKNGTKKTALKKVLPGYVLVRMIMNDETWYVVRNTRGVTGFVGPGSKPVALTSSEMRALGIDISGLNKEEEPKEVINFKGEVGDNVIILTGAWANMEGKIEAINTNRQMLVINVDMFGRDTPVEIGFADVRLT